MGMEGSLVGHSQLFHQAGGFDRVNGFCHDFVKPQFLKTVINQGNAGFVCVTWPQ